MMTGKERQETAEIVMSLSKRLGAKDCAVHVNGYREVEVQIREGKIEKLQESVGRSLNLDLYVDGRYSSHNTSKLDPKSLTAFTKNAVALTRYLAIDEFRRLPEPELSRPPQDVELQIMDSQYENLDLARRVELAKRAEHAALSCQGPIISVTSNFNDSQAELTTLNSVGFHCEQASTRFSLSTEVTVKDGDRGRPEGDSWANLHHLAELPDPESIGKEATRRAMERIGQTKLSSGTYDLVIENRVAARLLSSLLRPLSAQALQQKNSFLEGKLGQAIASKHLTVIDDPLLPKGLASRRFDWEGIASRRRVIINGGELKAYMLDNYYGRKLGMKPTGGSFSNILLEGGSGKLEDLLKTLDRGILITGFIGGNSNQSTGDFSFGVSGFLVEKGLPVKPMNEMNLTGNLLDLWKHLEGLGGDPYPYSSWHLPSLVFRGTQLSGA